MEYFIIPEKGKKRKHFSALLDRQGPLCYFNAGFFGGRLWIPTGVLLSSTVKNRIAQLRSQGVLIIDSPYQLTQLEGVVPDAVLPEGIAYAHRTGSDFDIYFLSNQTDKEQTFMPTFRHRREDSVIYNPVTDESMPFLGSVTLPPYGSLFVCYGDNNSPYGTYSQYAQDVLTVRTGRTNEEPWDISFRESGVKLSGQQPFDWSQHADNKIRYFSGHARYTTKWKMKKKQLPKKRAWLSFPNVKDIAHVWVNGKDCGIAWTAPYEVEITGALKKGANTIEIEVVNTWNNALRGADQGKAPYEGIWTNAKYRAKGDALLPAGLLEQPILKME